MKKIFSLILAIAFTLTLSAQNWTKEMQKDFRDSKDIAVIVDLSNATICGATMEEFPEYYGAKSYKGKEFAAMVLENIKNDFKISYRMEHKLPNVDAKKAKYVIHFEFQEITEDGAFSGIFYVMQGNNKSAEGSFRQRAGRWNDFEVLMKENIKKYFNRKVIHNTCDPLEYSNLCKY